MWAEVCKRDGIATIPWSALHVDVDDLEVGTLVGGAYRLDCLLGEGAMGRVFEATQLTTNVTVALKVLNRDLPSLPDANPSTAASAEEAEERGRSMARRFFRESWLASRVAHPNVVSIHEFGVDRELDRLFIAMEFVPGQTLHQVLDAEGTLELARALCIAIQLAAALAAAHRQSLVHRDLKPANIMVSPRSDGADHVTVLDFGVARSMAAEGLVVTAPGIPVGTPRYMSPEQARGHDVDGRSDLYALGCLLHEMLLGRAPFSVRDALLRMTGLEDTPTPPLELPEGIPAPWLHDLRALHGALLRTCPDDRPASAEDVQAALERLRAWLIRDAPEAARVRAPAPAEAWPSQGTTQRATLVR